MPMDLIAELEALRRQLHELAAQAEPDLPKRYALRRPPRPPGWYWWLRSLLARGLSTLESMRLRRPARWPVALEHTGRSVRAKPLLIWALGVDRDTLRKACRGFAALDDLPGYAPVLVTDVADFAFFSRLGWLVEYVPTLSGEGQAYDERKARFLARLYAGAAALPVRAGLEMQSRSDEIRRWVRGDR